MIDYELPPGYRLKVTARDGHPEDGAYIETVTTYEPFVVRNIRSSGETLTVTGVLGKNNKEFEDDYRQREIVSWLIYKHNPRLLNYVDQPTIDVRGRNRLAQQATLVRKP